MTDITDASRFHLRFQGETAAGEYRKIEAELGRFNPLQHEDLERPVKKGTICCARFKLDDSWYRAKVIQSVAKGEFEVEFIDFGNSDTVSGNTGDLKKLPESLLHY